MHLRRLRLLFATILLVVPTAAASATSASRPSVATPQRLEDHEDAVTASGSPSDLVAQNFEVLGRINLGGGSPNGDVFLYDHGGDIGTFAYVGTWSQPCSGAGVKVIDVNDPTRPKLVAYAGHAPGVSTEEMVVRRIGGRDVWASASRAAGRDTSGPGARRRDRPQEPGDVELPAGSVRRSPRAGHDGAP